MPSMILHIEYTLIPLALGMAMIDFFGHTPFSFKQYWAGFWGNAQGLSHNFIHSWPTVFFCAMFVFGMALNLILDGIYQ